MGHDNKPPTDGTPPPPSHLRADPGQMSVSDVLKLLSMSSGGNGTVDVATIGPDDSLQRAATFAVAFVVATLQDGRRPFKEALVILPPTRAASDFESAIKGVLVTANASEELVQFVLPRCRCERIDRLDSAAVRTALQSTADHTATYVDSAALYRTPGLRPDRLQEPWVPHLKALTDQLAVAVRDTGRYAFIDAGYFQPTHQADRETLIEAEAGVIGTSPQLSPGASALSESIHALATSDPDALSAVMSAIQSSKEGSQLESAILRSLAFYRANRSRAAWAVIEPIWEEIANSIADTLIPDVARVAADAGQYSQARQVLATLHIASVGTDTLEQALFVAHRAGDRTTQARIAARLQSVYPESHLLAKYLLSTSLFCGDYKKTLEHAANTNLGIEPRERAYWTALATALSTGDEYQTIATSLHSDFPDRENDTLATCARIALTRREFIDAIDLVFSIDPEADRAENAMELAVEAIEGALLLRTKDGRLVLDADALSSAIAMIALTTARHPRNADLRIAFTRLLSVEVAGRRGDAILAFLLLALAGKPEVAEVQPREQPATDQEKAAFLEQVFGLFPNGITIVPGLGELPADITAHEARRMIPTMRRLLQTTLDATTSDRDLRPMTFALHAAVLTANRAGERSQSIDFFRAAAVQLAATGFGQDARDIIEHMLTLTRDDDTELRRAWLAYADTYHRTGDVHEALVGAVLGFSLRNAQISASDIWHEIHLTARLLRDIGLFSQANSVLKRGGDLVSDQLPTAAMVRIETCRLSIQAKRYSTVPTSDVDLRTLAEELATNLRRVIEVHDEVAPALILLVQIAERLRARGHVVSDEIAALIAEAEPLAPPALRERIRALGDPASALDAMSRFTERTIRTRFASDVAYDITPVAILAHRALTQGTNTVGEAISLIDILSDRAIAVTDGAKVSDPDRLSCAIESLQASGIDLHMLALDERHRLVHVGVTSTTGERTCVLEPTDVFSGFAYSEWQRCYPYDYAWLDTQEAVMADAVRRSMDKIGISEAPAGPTVVVADVSLQKLPLNLLRVDGDFLGDLQPVCSAPSLDWLADCASSSLIGPLAAWIPDPLLPEDAHMTLGPLADRLAPTLEDYGVKLHRNSEPPQQMRGAALAIVAAHGGVLPDDQFFQVVRNDGDERWTARELAQRVGDAGLVVLFVCNSGRLDEQPWGRATVGLARHFLANGCKAVVASPWPLYVGVPFRWLPPFLAALAAGKKAVTAVHEANKAVSCIFSNNAVHAHAMHLYGNPMVHLRVTQRG